MFRVLACALLVTLGACQSRERAAPPPPPPPTPPAPLAVPKPTLDPHSLARPDRVVVKHLSLDLSVDFATKVLSGAAKLQLVRKDPAATEVILDTDGLEVLSVSDCASKQPLAHQLAPADKLLGRALTITLASDCVNVAYRTSPMARALLWVDPAGTAGKKQPMLFTQSQAILARTWIPLQDTPGVRFTYDAKISVPRGLWALMSAANPQVSAPDGVYTFTMDQPIPSYLMALAVGELAFKPIGTRTGVYAEPSVVDAAAYEFAEVDAMMAAAEKLYGPYRWGRYDMLVLPPSFPFGGMENPRLTFLTPTVINGDRALVSLIAHELAHSWSGNLVTNSTWNDLWLNEGFTTYVERRIMEELRGKERTDLSWAMGRVDLEELLASTGRTNPDTRLALALDSTRSPDDVPSDVAYEKGALFLRAMELALGRDVFDPFIRARFDRLAFQSTDTKTFEVDAEPLFAQQRVGWTLAAWLHQPGLPPTAPPSSSARYDALAKQAAALAATGALPDASTWTTSEWNAFLRAMPKDIAPEHLKALDAKYKLTASTNAPRAMHWLPIMIRADLREAAPAVQAYFKRIGRRWLVRTVYEAAITKNEYWRNLAATTFEQVKATYHPVTRDSIGEMLAAPTKAP
ncbi:MAG: M1 family metallopeptidase [Kofleriaceae bacterium]|nr:M1 family metallopeptidase [Kofleriaceae bacterium]